MLSDRIALHGHRHYHRGGSPIRTGCGYGYAVEYDYAPPHQLRPTLETIIVTPISPHTLAIRPVVLAPTSRIWAESWNVGAVYSPDGMTIQFDNGTVWQRDVGPPPSRTIPPPASRRASVAGAPS